MIYLYKYTIHYLHSFTLFYNVAFLSVAGKVKAWRGELIFAASVEGPPHLAWREWCLWHDMQSLYTSSRSEPYRLIHMLPLHHSLFPQVHDLTEGWLARGNCITSWTCENTTCDNSSRIRDHECKTKSWDLRWMLCKSLNFFSASWFVNGKLQC